MHWTRILDQELIPPLSDAASNASGIRCRCEPDLVNGDLRVVIPKRIGPEVAKTIREAVFAKARELRPGLNDCQVYIKTPQVTTFTAHLSASPQNVRPFETHSYITTFDLLLSDVIDFRHAEAKIATLCENATRVATFALGGVSTLVRLSAAEWDSLAIKPVVDGVSASDLTREKYHLLPGLNWRSQVDSKQVFIDWLCSINVSGKILLFDTGTEGNGPRQIFNLIQEQLPHRDTRANLELEIIGIVDGDNPKSLPDENEGRSRNGNNYIMTVEYITVPRVLSEDFQSLIGYRKLDRGGYLEPLRDVGIVRLVHDEKIVQISAADNLASVFRGYMTNAIGGPARLARSGREVLTSEVERALVEEVLDYAYSGEVQELQTACAIGLISELDARHILHDIDSTYAQELQEYPRHVWSFIEKTILIKLDRLYEILRDVARRRGTIAYSELSEMYQTRAGDLPNPRKAWAVPLQQMNYLAATLRLPPLSAVVICREDEAWPGTESGLPIESFWGSAGVPPRPATKEARYTAWREILDRVFQYEWPDRFPGTV